MSGATPSSNGGSSPVNLLDLVDELEPLSDCERRERLERVGLSPEQRRQVENCLRFSDSAAAFLERPAAEAGGLPSTEPPPSDAIPELPGYEILSPLGEGGMGTVWRAVQVATRRQVALKLMRVPHFGADRARVRFMREVQIAALLEHANIARVYDSGVHQGIFYYAMELVEGEPLDRYVDSRKLGRRQVLGLMRTVCRAVQHAHQNGVIHRDLKPGNILVNNDGQPKVLDFGLARMVADGDSDVTVTRDGGVAGTLAYMSPEQAAGRLERLDTRTDVYSLGATLYALLTGRPPHDQSGSHYVVVGRIVGEEVRRPRQVNKGIDAELESLLLKSLSKDAGARYASAGELAADLDNYLNGEPLAARRATLWYFARKRLRRRWASAVTAAAAVVVVAGCALWLYGREVRQRSAALAAAREVELERATNLITQSRLRLDEEKRLLLTAGYLTWKSGAGTRANPFESSDQSFSVGPKSDYACAAGMRDDQFVAGTDDGMLMIWDAGSGRLIRLYEGFGKVRRVAASPDGGMVAAASVPRSLFLLDVSRGGAMSTLSGFRGEVIALAFSPDGRSLLVGTDDSTENVYLFAVDGRQVRTFRGQGGLVRSVAFTPDGRRVVVASGSAGRGWKPCVALWEVDGAAPVWRQVTEPVTGGIGVSPDGGLIVASSSTASIIYDGRSGEIKHLWVFRGSTDMKLSPADIRTYEKQRQK